MPYLLAILPSNHHQPALLGPGLHTALLYRAIPGICSFCFHPKPSGTHSHLCSLSISPLNTPFFLSSLFPPRLWLQTQASLTSFPLLP